MSGPIKFNIATSDSEQIAYFGGSGTQQSRAYLIAKNATTNLYPVWGNQYSSRELQIDPTYTTLAQQTAFLGGSGTEQSRAYLIAKSATTNYYGILTSIVSTQTRTLIPPSLGTIMFSTTFFSDASLNAETTGLDASQNTYWVTQVQGANWQNPDNSGVTLITIQNPGQQFGAHTLQFINWDFSANNPSSSQPIGLNGINIFNSDASDRWDMSTNMIVGIPQKLLSNNQVLLPVAIKDSSNGLNVIAETNNNNAVPNYQDLYAVLGNPLLTNVVNAYDVNLTKIPEADVNFRSSVPGYGSSASTIYVDKGWSQSSLTDKPPFWFYGDAFQNYKLDPSINLVVGQTYTFKRTTDASNNPGQNPHPFYISNNIQSEPSSNLVTLTPSSGYNPTSISSTPIGITGNESFTLKIKDTFTSSDQLFWYCTNHSTLMLGEFEVIGVT